MEIAFHKLYETDSRSNTTNASINTLNRVEQRYEDEDETVHALKNVTVKELFDDKDMLMNAGDMISVQDVDKYKILSQLCDINFIKLNSD